MQVNVRFLGIYRDFAGTIEGTYDVLEPVTVGRLIEELVARHEKFQPFKEDIRVLINGLGAAEDDLIGTNDEVILVDPISGGSALA